MELRELSRNCLQNGQKRICRWSISLEAFTPQAWGKLGEAVVFWNDDKKLAEETTS